MRCPKCGYISFDHLTSCAKCGKDVSDVASELQGTTINVEAPMFLSGALAAYAERQEAFGDQGMGFEVGEGIDFSMEEETVVSEPAEMAATDENVDISFTESPEEVDISMDEEETAGIGGPQGEAVDFTIEAEAEEEVAVKAAPGQAEESFEELDLMSAVDEEEGGLEFDLEDFIEEMDEDKSREADDEDIDIDIDLDEEEK